MWPAVVLILLAGWAATGLAWRRHSRRVQDEAVRAAREREHREAEFKEELLREHAEREIIFDCMIEGLVVLDASDRIVLINETVRRLFRITADVRGRSLLEALRRHELQELAARAQTEGQALGLEMDLVSENSRICYLEVNASAFRSTAGERRGVILVFHDVTRLNELEATRREFVANVSHELRTPITIIKGYVETLLDGSRNDPALSLRFLQTIEKHTNRLTFLIEDLLTISQLEEGRIVVNRQWGDLRPMVARILEDFGTRAITRDTRLINRVPEDLPIRADLDRVQQVLVNLIENAIKYGRAQGTVEVDAALNPARDRIELRVTDDGPGIPKEFLHRIFERFYRVDSARSREQGGTGLGLSIVKHIVQAHGGEVSAESQPGHGTTFRFTLPWEPPGMTHSEPKS